MAALQLTSAASSISTKGFTFFEGLRALQSVKISSLSTVKQNGLSLMTCRPLVVKAATTVAPKGVKELGKEYIKEMELQRIDKIYKNEARKEALRIANKEKKRS